MASRRQKQFERKYSSYKKFTATEDVNYSTHSSRSSYRSESQTSRKDSQGRSTSTELVSGSETRSYPVYIAIQDYRPEPTEVESIALEQGQIVEVLDQKNAARWLVRTKARPPQSGWVPGSYFEKPTEYYKQRRMTREINSSTSNMTEEQEAVLKRDQVYHDLLRSEEEFVSELRSCVDDYIRVLDDPGVPPDVAAVREKLALNVAELYNFHANVMLKGLNYYSDDPGKVGQTFVRLERDFDHHVQFYKELPETLELLEKKPIKEFFQSLADKCEAGSRSFSDHLKNVADRMTQYQTYFKEFVKYSTRASHSSKSMQKALELTLGVPQRAHDMEFTNTIINYPGDTSKLGRLIRHDTFQTWEGDESPKERYVFLFKNKIMITEKDDSTTPPTYKHYASIRVDKYTVRTFAGDEETIVLKPNEPGLPSFRIKPKDFSNAEYVTKAWLRDIAEEHEEYAAERDHETETTTDFDANMSDIRSEFSEYSSSRKSSLFTGPEEGGPPRKKIKSPPVISPTGSSASLYSGGSSVDWTTTGTTLEMQGTRVTRTQYGFRTLQESSAKMCLKVTGYPLPEITWYKDDVQLHEDERHTFYADEDGFFAMTIDPVQVDDTGRYTCMATNEYGQASTSAFFRVLKVEKEAAPPAFVNVLKDQECKEGEVISFECEVEGWPEPELVWLVDDQPLRPSHDFKLQYDGQNAKLEIRDAQPDDTGVYTVKIQNEYGTAESKAELMVQPDPDKNHVAPEFQAMIEDVECDEGAEVKFKAVITGDPNPEISWMINGIPLSESEKIRFISEDGICILIIKDVTRHFDGIVTCQGTNRLGSTTCDGRLKVRVPPAPPNFRRPLEDKIVQEKYQVSFEVDIEGFPDPTVTFSLKGKELKHGVDGVEIQGHDGYYKLTISDVTIDGHDGEIVCKAVNEHGTAESRARLTVEPQEEESRSAPTFIKDIEDQTVKSGQLAVFETTVRGHPEPEVSWYVNGHKMDNNSPGIKIEVINHDHKLTIDSAQYAGTVVCRAENAVGRFETKARLIVLPVAKPKKAPVFTEKLVDKSETEENNVIFEVRVEAEPKPDIKWFLNGEDITNSSRVETRDFDGSIKLELKNISLKDAGEIKCVATNSEGSAESVAKLAVNRKPFAPAFDQVPKSVTVERGQEAEFRAHADGAPAPTYTWSIDGRKVRETTDGARVSTEDGVSVLRIDTSIHSSATISVIAENNLGADETGVRLIVEDKKPEPKVIEQVVESQAETTTVTTTTEGTIEISKIETAPTTATTSEEIITEERTEENTVTETRTERATSEKAPDDDKQTAGVSAKPDVSEQVEKVDEVAKDATEVKVHEPIVPEITVEQVEETSKTTMEEKVQESVTSTTRVEPEVTTEKVTVEEKTEESFTSTTTEIVPPKVESPRITRDLKNQTVNKGDLAHFEVVIEHATEVVWSHNDKTVTSSTNGVTISQDDKFEFRLSLDSTIFPAGPVSVKGSNVSGSVQTKCELNVFEELKETKKPEFTDNLKDIEVKKGQPFQIDVIALNSPEFTWTLNGKPMEDGKGGVHIVDDGNKSSLVVDKADMIHDGKVTVEAKNEVGSSESSAKITVTQPATPPVIVLPPSNVSIKEGDTAEFKVKITGYPAPDVKWTINDKLIEASSCVKIISSETLHTLTITETTISFNGTVKVSAENTAGTASETAKLKVEPYFDVPQFKGSLTDKDGVIGEPIRWDIGLVVPYPGTTLEWTLNGEKLTPSSDVEIADHGDGTYHLTLKNPKEMSGTVAVKAVNPAGEVASSAKVNITKGSRKPEFTKAPQNHETNIDESVKFSAIVTGDPTPKVSWFLNGKKLENSEEVKVSFEEETGKTSIRIHKPQISDSGDIKVTAENEAGKVEASATLKVERKTEVPKFTSNMDDRQVNEGDNVKYTSTVEGFPAPVVEWTLNGEPVSKFPNVKVSDQDGQHTIEIVGITPEQSGELSCQATNDVGLKKQNVTLAVKRVGEAPTFARNLEDRLVTEGEVTVMEAKLNQVKPKPTITWLKDGKEFKADDHWKLIENDDGTLQLKIVTTNMEDKARITIKAENHFGTAECAASLGVVKKRPMAKPAFQSDISPINLTEGDSLQTKLLITGDPTPFVKWYINGQLVVETEDTEISNANGVYSLTIHGVSADMTGKIKCVAYNKAGEVSTEGPLKVVAPIPVEFETCLCDATCREGDTLKLKAVLLGEPTPVVSWYVNGKKLEESQNIKIHAEKGTYTVTIKDITCDYSGKVVCEAVNEYGTASSEAMLLVLPRGEPPDFLEWLSNVRARQGSKVVHKVVFTGDPKPNLTWYINNKEITSSTKDITIVTTDKTSILTINNFNPDIHVGEIICKAENDAGEVSCTANMATYTSEQFSESESDAQADENMGDDLTATDDESLRDELHRTPTPVMAPKFITKIKDNKTKKGHEAIFECVVPDTKGVCCKWLKDGKEIELIARIRVQTRNVDGKVFESLIIEDVRPEDVGRYTVVVENSAGKDQCEANLIIEESLDKTSEKAPDFVVKLQDKTTKASEKVVFECKVVGEPQPKVTWMHENTVIEKSEKITIESSSEGVQRMVISSTEKSHEGQYTCIAENSAGTTKTEAKLKVEAQAPAFTKTLEDMTLTYGSKLTLSCSVKGLPQPHVEFFRESTKITSSNRISIEHDATNTHWRLVINETLKEELNCSYKAVATNDAGSAETKCQVKTKDVAPVFEQGLKKTTVKEKEEIRMEVKVSGTEPEVSWFKDNEPVKEDGNHEIQKNPATGTYALVVKQANLADAGTYTAKAVNPAGAAESTAAAEVTVALQAPTFIKELVSTEVKVSESATLSVTVKGVPTPDVVWQKDGSPVKIDGSHVVSKSSEDGSHSITINSARLEDAGKYSCKAVNPAGEATTAAQFNVAKQSEAPQFTEKLQPMTVKETESLSLSVTVTGAPAPTVQWFKNDQPVQIDNQHVLAKDEGAGHFTLTIKDARTGDVGTYSCKATNEAGEATTAAPLNVAEQQVAPHFVEGLKPLEVEEGKPAELAVTVEGKPEPEVQWFKDGAPVAIDNQHVVKKEDGHGHYTLVIDQVRSGDTGTYTCKAVNPAGKEESIGEIKIPKYGFEKASSEEVEPLFVEPLKETVAAEGDTVVLQCRVNKEAKPEIKFYKNDQPVELGQHMTLEVLDDGQIKLKINNATKEDVGSYRCEAVNKAGKAKTQAPLDIKYAATVQEAVADESEQLGDLEGMPDSASAKAGAGTGPPEFIELLRSCTVSVSEESTLKCKVRGEPRPKIKWTRDGKEVEMSTRIKSVFKEDGTITLTISNTNQQDAGEYRCFAENEFGTAWTEAPITVTAVGAAKPSGDAPDFLEPIRPAAVTEGETAVLEGKISGKPKPTVKWYKNGKEIKPDDHVKIENLDDGTQRLTVTDSKLSDADEYRCEASNEYGDVWSDVTLTVKEKALSAPTFTKKLVEQSVTEGESVKYECKVEGVPQPEVKWFKDNKEISAGDSHFVQTKSDDGTATLVIKSTELKDGGDIKVEAINKAGRATSEAPLNVGKQEELKTEMAPEFARDLQASNVNEGEIAQFECKVSGFPAPVVRWFKDGEEVKPGNGVTIESKPDGTNKLIIDKTKTDDQGNYRVEATNNAGSMSSKAPLSVNAAETLKLKRGLNDLTVPKGTKILLSVEVEGQPKTVKWYKGSEQVSSSKTTKLEKVSDVEYKLEIESAELSDAATYRVVLSTETESVESSSKVVVTDTASKVSLPSFKKGLEDKEVPKGEPLVLEVEVEGQPKTVKWYKNGDELKGVKAEDLGNGKYRLTIPDFKEGDVGEYSVVAGNEKGEIESKAKITVKAPSGGVQVVQGLKDQTVPKGQTAVLEVTTSKKPKQVKWYKNGKELAPGDKAEPKKIDDNKYQLVIPDADEDDAADYKVVLVDDDGSTADSGCALTVKLPAEEPRFVKGLEDVVVPVGEAIKLDIKTSGSPKTVKWYKNGQLLPGAAADKIKINKIDDNTYTLEIPKSAVDDSGDYKVEIENDAGKANSSGKITVEPKLTFLKPLKDLEITEGENAEFVVETNAKPRTVKWYKNGQEIKPDSRISTSGDDTKYKLVIKNATKDDAANFKVVLSNSAGDADSSAKLTVKKAKAGVPKISAGLEDQIVAEGSPLVFTVKIEGEPTDVRWLKDASPLSASARLLIEKIDDQTYRLTIPKAELSDAGRYTVEVSNESGKAKSDATGEVDEKPSIVKGLNDVEVSVGDDDVFKVEVSTPVRTVKWYKNGQEIKPSSHLEPKKVSPKKYELCVNKAQLDDGAEYKVVLSNAAGECDSSASLTVTKPNVLKMLEGLKDIDVDEGKPIELKAKVEGIPKTVKWYKNGQEIAPSDDVQFTENPATGEYSLLIPTSKKSDGAAYRILLGNDKGEIYSGAVAHVKASKPKDVSAAANFLSPLQDTEVEEGDTLTLKCVVGGEPFPEITWEKDGVELKKDDRIAMRVALDGTVTLRIRDVKKSEFGQYRVKATNESGTATSACLVTVKDKGEEPSKPRFIIPLKNTEAVEGEKAEFNIKIRASPKADLQWFLNDVPLVFDSRVSVEDIGAGNYCLTFKTVLESDFGTLRCIATNEHGKDECQSEFSKITSRVGRMADDDRYPPRFNVPLWDRRIPVNDPMSIECHVDAKPTAEIEWFKDGVKLVASDGIEIRNSSDGACRVRIARFTEADFGVYMCVATNPLGVADTRSNYSAEIVEHEEQIKKKEYAPRFNPGLEDRNVTAGQTIKLSCTVDAIPRASVVWYKDGLPLRSDSRTTIEYNEDGSCSLTLSNAVDSDNGAYRCVATNEHGTINTSCLVNVKVPKTEVVKEGEEPFFTKGLVDVWADRGDTFTLKCAVQGDPFPEIKWYRNGTLVRNGPRTVIETAADGSCSLTVKECTMSDEGIYRCEAENKHGKAKTQATSHVQMAIGKSDKPKLSEGQAPRFILPLDDQTVTLGSIIDLECKVTGQPMPQVKWSKDGGPIWEDIRYDWDIDEAKGTYHLRIKNSTVNDEGTYRCVATNESGSCTTKAFVRIDDGLLSALPVSKTTPPRFSIKLGDARATEGSPLKLECKVEGSPMPELTWHKDGAQIVPSDRLHLQMDPDGTARLIIPCCNMDDDGIYRVIATNSVGSASDKGNAVVKRAAKDEGRRSADRDTFDSNKAPRLIEPLENKKVADKEGFRLRCKFSGEPKPTIKWFKDGERVFPYGRLQLNELPDGTCELVVDSASRQDAGGYRCVAENQYGSARTTCDVTVSQKDRRAPRDVSAHASGGKAPGFTTPLTIKRAKPGDTVTFDCLPYGTPFPTIKWLKDGLELFPDNKVKMESDADGTQRLILSNVEFLSEGYYRCVATNEHGTASTKAELCMDGDRSKSAKPATELAGPPEDCKPRIRRGLYNMSIHQGSVVEMLVCATGTPTPTVEWYKDGEKLTSDGPDGRRVIFTDERGIHHLVILNSGPEDEGEYSLEATNRLGSARTEGSLNIIRPRQVAGFEDPHDKGGLPFPPGFVRQLKNKHVFNHMPTIFDCLVVGHPAPEVEWFHNGKKIIPGGRVKIQSCGGGSHAIIILDTTVEDAGEYVAVAKNSHGTASSSAILDVTVPHLDNIKFNGEIDVTPYLTEEYGFKKLNYASLPTPPDHGPFIKEVTGHYLTLSWIPTKRAPPRYPQVTYVIEIRELPEKEWTLLDYNIPEPVCKVRNLELGKSYQFRVRAENIYGISDPSPASPPSRLMAPPQPVIDKRTKKIIPLLDPYAERALDLAHAEQYACAPWFAPGVVEKRFCAENDTMTIILNVSGYPDPDLQWKFRGWDIDTTSPTSQYKVYTYGGTETTLTITGFTKDNVGQYQCIATNAYGDAQQNIMVDLATRPNFIQPLTNRTFSSAQPMKLDVRVEGQPFPELKWMKEWRPIVESTRVKFVKDGPYLCSLIITDPMWRDSGVYTCVAINDAGQTTTSCTVTVEADGDYNDVELPKKKATVEARKVKEIYEIEEDDEKLAASGAPFHVKERKTGKVFLAQLKPIDDALKRNVEIHNSLEHPNIIQFHQVLQDEQLALVVYEDANDIILGTLNHSGGEQKGGNREETVQIFVRQLLLALQHMHNMRIAHLDLRPETILLQDDKLKLADFGQARRLLRGMITGTIQGSPEFVSPEIVRGYPLTLATDLWSVGTLAYVLLTGISPFHGDNDNETLENVDKCRYSIDGPDWALFSYDAIDFIKKLLQEVPAKRMTCEEALQHPWLTDPKLQKMKISADCLREFKYKHKWLERRVFVQQTPSEQLLEAILAPPISVAQPSAPARPAEGARPVEIYDYLRIKERPPPSVEDIPYRRREREEPTWGKYVPRGEAAEEPLGPEFDRYRPTPNELVDPRGLLDFDPRQRPQGPVDPRKVPLDHLGRLVRPEDLARIPHDQFGRPIQDSRIPVDQFGRPIAVPEQLSQPLQQFGPTLIDQFGRVVAPPGRHPSQQDPSRPPPPEYSMVEKKKLVPQEKGETPSKRDSQGPHGKPTDRSMDPYSQVPLRMIRGEHRQIEEEIANRILSDISEEGSVAGSLASLDDFEAANPVKQYYEQRRGRSRTRSSTPKAESDASTPTLSPVNTVREGNFFPEAVEGGSFGKQRQPVQLPGVTNFFPDSTLDGLPARDKQILEQAENDPQIPVGAPLFLEGLHNNNLTIDTTPRPITPSHHSPRRSKPGTKSPVMLSPSQEHSMEVIIATKRGKPGFLSPGEIAPEIDDEDAKMDERKKKIRPSKHGDDDDFKDLRDKLDRDKNRRKAEQDDLDKYRPSNFYKDDDRELEGHGYDIDDSPWDSHYQIGPDTYLMATRGATFNSRVRDYRRNLWGEGAPLVKQGILGWRNQDVTVRERRRYTDILREQQTGVQPKSSEHGTVLQKAPSSAAIERIKADIEKVSPCATKKNADGTFAPIFSTRLRDAYLTKTVAIFECSVQGTPAPKIVWSFQDRRIETDGRCKVEQVANICRLTITSPAAFDLGEYTCTASNEYGSDKTTSRLISGEAPSRPGRPECELSSDTELFMTWEAPEGPTYLEGITYRLEYRMAGPNDFGAPWKVINDHIDDEAVVVKHLDPLGVYQFRAIAKNGFGWGVPSLTSRIVQTHGKGTPKLQLDALRQYVRLNVVSVPQSAGGNQLDGISEESEDDESKTLQVEDMQLKNEEPTNRFQIDDLLFKGKFSVIRQAVDSKSEGGAHCMAKIRHPASDKNVKRELDTLKEAQNENVQHLVAAYQNNDFLYLFCERLYEDVFARFIFNDYYNEEQVSMTVRQITSALHWLHFKGIAHLDVNPHNAMFSSKRSWIVKLVDFGSAQFLSEAVKPTEFDVQWAAPEFHIPETPVTVQSDVWGMGVITFCLLGGFHPFTSEYDGIDEVKENVMNVKCDPNLIPVNASQESLSFVTWALKKSPLRRMRTDEALSHRFLSSDPSMIRRRESIKYSASRLRRTAMLTKQEITRPASTELENKYGGKTVQ